MSAPSSMWSSTPCSCRDADPPTLRAIPRAPRLPRDLPRPVEEIRYDLAECTAGAEVYSTARVRALAKTAERVNRYAGLATPREREALTAAIDVLIDRAPDLGARFGGDGAE